MQDSTSYAPRFWLGFATLSAFLKEVAYNSPAVRPTVYLSPVIVPTPFHSGSSLSTSTQLLACESALANGAIAYIRMVVGRWVENAGEPMPGHGDAEKVRRRLESLESLTRGSLDSAGFRVVSAVIARPDNLVWLKGDNDLAVYDPETDLFRLKAGE